MPSFLIATTFLGQPCGSGSTHGVNPEMQVRLRAADDAVQAIYDALAPDERVDPSTGRGNASFSQWAGISRPHVCWRPNLPHHSAGAAIDVEAPANPRIMTRGDVLAVYDRAVQFMTPSAAGDVRERQPGESTASVWTRFKAVSDALAGYVRFAVECGIERRVACRDRKPGRTLGRRAPGGDSLDGASRRRRRGRAARGASPLRRVPSTSPELGAAPACSVSAHLARLRVRANVDGRRLRGLGGFAQPATRRADSCICAARSSRRCAIRVCAGERAISAPDATVFEERRNDALRPRRRRRVPGNPFIAAFGNRPTCRQAGSRSTPRRAGSRGATDRLRRRT